MPNKVERFDLSGFKMAEVERRDRGTYVRYSDYEKLEAERDDEIQRTSRWETRCVEADEERDQTLAQLETTKRAWLDADKERIAENTKVLSAATDKRQELEAELQGARKQRDEELGERLGMSEAEVVGIAAENYAEAINLVRDLLIDAQRIYEPGFEDPPHIAAAKNLGHHEEALRLLGLLDSIFEEADDA